MMYWKILGMKWSWCNWSSLLSWNLWGGTEESHE